jgi:hypothetical protein
LLGSTTRFDRILYHVVAAGPKTAGIHVSGIVTSCLFGDEWEGKR